MHVRISASCLAAFLLLSFTIIKLEAQTPAASFASLMLHPESPSSSFSTRATDNDFLDSMFSPHTIPLSGTPVLENSLGDIVHDSIVNLLDLLRLRNILGGIPPAASPTEVFESDLDGDGNVTESDIAYLRDVLLHRAGIPYLVDSLGGDVLGAGIRLTIPPGALDSVCIITVSRMSDTQFALEMGVDMESAARDSAFFMAAFDISSTRPDFKLPVNTTIKLDSIPPCAYQGLNGLFAAVPDRDGDGRSELFLINALNPQHDSLTITSGELSIAKITGLSPTAVEPGNTLSINGTEFGTDEANIVVEFKAASSDSIHRIPPWTVSDSSIMVVAPAIPPESYSISIHNVLTGIRSNSQSVGVLPPGAASGDIRSIISGFFNDLATTFDSVGTDTLFAPIEDPTVRAYYSQLRSTSLAFVDSQFIYFSTMDDSDIQDFADIAAFLQNQTRNLDREYLFHNQRALRELFADACDEDLRELNGWKRELNALIPMYKKFGERCVGRKNPDDCRDCNKTIRIHNAIYEAVDQIAALQNLYLDCLCKRSSGTECTQCQNTVFVGIGPQGKMLSGGFASGKFSTKGVCINIIRYKRNVCIVLPKRYWKYGPLPSPDEALSKLECPPPHSQDLANTQDSWMNLAHAGSIIKATNVPVPYNIVGILNDNGNAFIPQVPFSTAITYSLFDPSTGFFDPDVGTFTTGATPGGFDRPILLFQPNTAIRTFTLHPGDIKHDSITFDYQRIDYLFDVGESDTSNAFNIAFRSPVRLSLYITDPDGDPLLDFTDLSCYSDAHIRFAEKGVYRFRIAFGVSGQSGSFDFGVNFSPLPPLPSSCLCGDILTDSLFSELSPYTVTCASTIPAGDTILAEPGVTLQFEPGGTIAGTGMLHGTGTPSRPIILKQSGLTKMARSTLARDPDRDPTVRRKEVER